jgi:hypothetical protein
VAAEGGLNAEHLLASRLFRGNVEPAFAKATAGRRAQRPTSNVERAGGSGLKAELLLASRLFRGNAQLSTSRR